MLLVLQVPVTSYNGHGVVYTSQWGDSTLACIVYKGTCGKKKNSLVLRGCRMHQFAQVIRKRVSISEDPQAKKRGIVNKEDNCRDVCVVRATSTEYDASY